MKSITSTIYMKPEAEGGRHFGLRQDYCPHLIPAGTDEWIPVRVTGIEGAEEASLGNTSTVTFQLMYDTLDYSALTAGHKFIIREGPKVVGEGRVTQTID